MDDYTIAKGNWELQLLENRMGAARYYTIAKGNWELQQCRYCQM